MLIWEMQIRAAVILWYFYPIWQMEYIFLMPPPLYDIIIFNDNHEIRLYVILKAVHISK